MNAPRKDHVKAQLVKLWEKLVEICEFAERHPLVGYIIRLILALIEWWLFNH